MKKLICSILVFALFLSLIPTAFAAESGRAVALSDFETSAHEFTTRESHNLLFTAHILTSNGRRTHPSVYDGEGRMITRLYDDGTHGDKASDDGIYSALINTNAKESKTVSYHVEADGIKSAEQEVIFYHMLMPIELVQHEKFWAETEAYRQSLRDEGKTPEEVLSLTYDYVKASELVDASTLFFANSYSFTFRFTFGTMGCIDEYSPEVCERMYDGAELTEAVGNGNASWEDPDFMVFRPYRQSPSAGDFINEFYTDIARDVCAITGGEMHDFQEREAYPGNLKDIYQYGFYIIDSHGTEAAGRSYMMMRRGDTSQYEYAADLSAGHILASGSDVGVTGSFFTKYVKDEGRELPGTLLYLVVCFGMSTDTICDPALDCDAQLVFGYTHSVSFTWDFDFSETLWSFMVKTHPQHPERTYTFEESLAAAKRANGDIDPYSVDDEPSDRGLARPRAKGNTDFVLRFDDYAPVAGFNITNKEISLYTAETAQVEYEITSEGLTQTEIAFISDDESIASIDENGVVTMMSEGVVQITATLTDYSDKDNPKELVDTCTVTGLGYLAASGIYLAENYIEVYENTDGKQIDAHVLPENATDKTLHYESANENIAVVSETGLVSPVNVGHTKITISHPDTDEKVTLECRVLPLTLSIALNAEGGDLAVQNDVTYPFVPVLGDDGLPCAQSSNQKKDSTLSWFRINGGQMVAGSTFSFDWRVSSEEKYDTLSFYVNDKRIESISGNTEWQSITYTVPEDGEYSFRISYMKDTQLSANDDAGYVRNIELHRLGERHTVYFFDIDGETLIESVEVEHGESAVPPEAPAHEGFVFEGWSRQTDRVLSDLRVYAVYTEVTEPEIMFGDVNGDRKINTADATYVLKVSAGMLTLSDGQFTAADVTHDGMVNTLDAVCILKFAAGSITGF